MAAGEFHSGLLLTVSQLPTVLQFFTCGTYINCSREYGTVFSRTKVGFFVPVYFKASFLIKVLLYCKIISSFSERHVIRINDVLKIFENS